MTESTSPSNGPSNGPGFFRKYRMPILLGILAVCLYAFSILYIVYGKGQIA